MRFHLPSSVVAAVISLLLCADAGAQATSRRVVVLGFTGPKAVTYERAASKAIAEQHTVVPAATWTKAQKRLKARRLTDEDVALVAADLQVDVVVSGVVKRAGAKWTLVLGVREGKTGKEIESLTITLRGNRLDKQAEDEIAALLLGAVDLAQPIAGEPEPEEAAPDPAAEAAAAEAAAAAAAAAAPPARLDARDVALDVSAGMLLVRRSLGFSHNLASGSPNTYDGGVGAGFALGIELYPMAFENGPAFLEKVPRSLGGLGIGFFFDRMLTLETGYEQTTYDTTQTRVGFNLRYRHNFGASPTHPTIEGFFGWAHLDFTIDRAGGDLGLPNVAYSYLDFGAAATIPLTTPKLAFVLDVHLQPVISAGEINEMAFYGDGSTFGFELNAGFEMLPVDDIVVRAGFHWQRFGHSFDGNGIYANMRWEADPTTVDVDGATDNYVGAQITAGWLF